MPKTWLSLIFENFFSSSNMLEIVVFADFHLTFFLQSIYVSYFTSFSIDILYLSLGRSNMQCACWNLNLFSSDPKGNISF